jgi:two-component system OmpR family sensor kinase
VSAQRSLRRDLAVGLSFGLGVMWLVAIIGAGLVVRQELNKVLDSALQETAERILPLAVIELINTGEGEDALRVSPVGPHEEYLTYVVRGRDGAILIYSHDADPANFGDGSQASDGFRKTADYRIFRRSTIYGTYVIEVAEPLAHRREAALDTMTALILPVLILLPLSLIGVAWFTAVRLRPVRALSIEVSHRDAADLTPLATEGLQAELIPIRDAVNRLMARLSATLDAERGFSANAAHELRTPIAAALAQSQRLITEATKGALRYRAEAIEAELKRLARLSEKLLQLARAEGGGVLRDVAQDIMPVARLVAGDFARDDARLELSLPDAPMYSRIDPDAFAILLRNLIENALRHGDANQPVRVALTADGALRIVNTGPVVPPEVLARLTTRFERAGSRKQGSGLGLAIVAAIARGAGLSLTLHSPAEGQADGFEARLDLFAV